MWSPRPAETRSATRSTGSPARSPRTTSSCACRHGQRARTRSAPPSGSPERSPRRRHGDRCGAGPGRRHRGPAAAGVRRCQPRRRAARRRGGVGGRPAGRFRSAVAAGGAPGGSGVRRARGRAGPPDARRSGGARALPARAAPRGPGADRRVSLHEARFAGSGLTVAALGGGTYLSAESLAQRVDTTLARLAEPGLVYLYWGDADKIAHHHGWQSPRWADGLSELDREIGRLARSLPPGTVLVVTADHGMVDVDPRALVDVATTPELAMGVELVAGEPRASHVYLTAGSGEGERDAALLRWRTVLGESALVTTRTDAVAAGWFGPVDDHVLPMIGDLVVAATGRAGVVDSRTQAPASLLLRGMHGSLTPGEMLVPLFVVA